LRHETKGWVSKAFFRGIINLKFCRSFADFATPADDALDIPLKHFNLAACCRLFLICFFYNMRDMRPFTVSVLFLCLAVSILRADEPLWTDDQRAANRDAVIVGQVHDVQASLLTGRRDGEIIKCADIEIWHVNKAHPALAQKIKVYYESGKGGRKPAYAELKKGDVATFYLSYSDRLQGTAGFVIWINSDIRDRGSAMENHVPDRFLDAPLSAIGEVESFFLCPFRHQAGSLLCEHRADAEKTEADIQREKIESLIIFNCYRIRPWASASIAIFPPRFHASLKTKTHISGNALSAHVTESDGCQWHCVLIQRHWYFLHEMLQMQEQFRPRIAGFETSMAGHADWQFTTRGAVENMLDRSMGPLMLDATRILEPLVLNVFRTPCDIGRFAERGDVLWLAGLGDSTKQRMLWVDLINARTGQRYRHYKASN
jgi:hypothetical protein